MPLLQGRAQQAQQLQATQGSVKRTVSQAAGQSNLVGEEEAEGKGFFVGQAPPGARPLVRLLLLCLPKTVPGIKFIHNLNLVIRLDLGIMESHPDPPQ